MSSLRPPRQPRCRVTRASILPYLSKDTSARSTIVFRISPRSASRASVAAAFSAASFARISGASMPTSRTLKSHGPVDATREATVIVSPSYTATTLPRRIGGRQLGVSSVAERTCASSTQLLTQAPITATRACERARFFLLDAVARSRLGSTAVKNAI